MKTDSPLIIFDLDGTLIDSAPDLANAVNTTLQTLGRPTYDEATIRHWVGNGARTLIGRALSGSQRIDPNINEALYTQALDLFMRTYAEQLCERTHLYEGVKESLITLHEKAFVLTIATNKPYAFVSPILKRLEIGHFFDAVVGGDSLALKKPHPEPLLHLCRTSGIAPEAAIMVGDSKNDILAAKKAKMPSVGVRYGYNYGEDLAIYEPDYIIDRFDALLEIPAIKERA